VNRTVISRLQELADPLVLGIELVKHADRADPVHEPAQASRCIRAGSLRSLKAVRRPVIIFS
jgi:hypothetical protein